MQESVVALCTESLPVRGSPVTVLLGPDACRGRRVVLWTHSPWFRPLGGAQDAGSCQAPSDTLAAHPSPAPPRAGSSETLIFETMIPKQVFILFHGLHWMSCFFLPVFLFVCV